MARIQETRREIIERSKLNSARRVRMARQYRLHDTHAPSRARAHTHTHRIEGAVDHDDLWRRKLAEIDLALDPRAGVQARLDLPLHDKGVLVENLVEGGFYRATAEEHVVDEDDMRSGDVSRNDRGMKLLGDWRAADVVAMK